jgi:GNAT superfamily N-acetyltransferase
LTAKEINEINREFWARQNALMEQRMADDAVRQVALARVESECSRGVPINRQVSLVAALEDLARERGFSEIKLETGIYSHAAIRTYERAGYARCERFGDYPFSPTSVYMTKTLS